MLLLLAHSDAAGSVRRRRAYDCRWQVLASAPSDLTFECSMCQEGKLSQVGAIPRRAKSGHILAPSTHAPAENQARERCQCIPHRQNKGTEA